MDPLPSGAIYLLAMFLSTIIVVVLLWQGASTLKARMSFGHEAAYRKLAEQIAAAERQVADEQKRIADALEDVRVRLAAIEKMLREVQ